MEGDWPDEVVSSETSEKWSGTSRTSRVPTEDKLESMGEVGVEMLEENVGDCRWP